MNSSTLHSMVLLGCIGLFAPDAFAYTELQIAENAVDLTPDRPSYADKARIFDMPDGTIVVFWHAQNGTPGQAWDLFGNTFAPRDIFARTSIDRGVTWAEPVNISDTASQTDASVFYDSVGDGSGIANFYGDSDKPTVFVSGSKIVVIWNDAWCGPGSHGPARYEVALGQLETPYRCLYAARMTIAAGSINLISVDRVTDGTRDVTNEVLRGTGAGFAIAWQEDPNGLQLGEARGEGDGSSGARVSPGTDIWYTWLPGSAFADPTKTWRTPVPVSDNFDYENGTVIGGGASRPLLALAGSPAAAVLVYEEAKNAGPEDPGKYVLYHQFPGSSPPQGERGTIVSNPAENARRARVMAQGTPGPLGTRLVVLWRQGTGIMGAPADVMMRVGRIPTGTDLATTPHAGFRVEDLWPAVDVLDPSMSAAPLNLSGAGVGDGSSIDPLADAKAHRAVMDGDVIFAGYTQIPDVGDPSGRYAYFGRWSADGGATWSEPLDVSTPSAGGLDIIEPRLLRTPSGSASGNPEDVRNPNFYVFAWGTQTVPGDGTEPQRVGLYLTRTTDRGLTLEPTQSLAVTKTAATQTDEQIQLKVTPDGQQVSMAWVRREGDESSILFTTAEGVTRTANLSVSGTADEFSPDIGEEFAVEFVVANAGPDTATGTLVRIAADSGLTLSAVSASAGACQIGASIECAPGEMPPGSAVSIALSLIAEDSTVYELSAVATALEAEPAPGDNDVLLQFEAIANADLSVAASPSVTDGQVGDDFFVDFNIANAGPQSATNPRLVVFVSEKLRVTGATGCRIDGQLVDCALAALAPGEDNGVRLLLAAGAKGRATVSAQVAADETDPVAANDSAEFTVDLTETLGGGCVYSPAGNGRDTLLALLLILAIARLSWRTSKPVRGVVQRD